MYDEISIEQRAHDLAVQATILNYQLKGQSIDSANASDFVFEYRSLLSHFLGPVEEGASDLR
ncbi:MAG: hypothetical protein K2I10_11745 [Lachnospiraceae bacterium]|nr:hypothetical protein [Lachnospiraceae bacterium]